VTEIYWSEDENILKQFWRVLQAGFEEGSNKYYFSNMFSLKLMEKWQMGQMLSRGTT
jgi:hypothetical protein